MHSSISFEMRTTRLHVVLFKLYHIIASLGSGSKDPNFTDADPKALSTLKFTVMEDKKALEHCEWQMHVVVNETVVPRSLTHIICVEKEAQCGIGKLFRCK